MGAALRKPDTAPWRFEGPKDYSVSNVVYFSRSKASQAKQMLGRVAAPSLSGESVVIPFRGPAAAVYGQLAIPRRRRRVLPQNPWLAIFVSFWFHLAGLVLLANLSTITKQVLPPAIKPLADKPAEVVMKLEMTQAAQPKVAPPPPKALPKAPPAPKAAAVPRQPKAAPVPAAPVAPKVPVVARQEPQNSGGGSPAPKSAPVASAAKSLSFLSSIGKSAGVSKSFTNSTVGSVDVPGGRNFDISPKSMGSGGKGAVALGTGTGGTGAAGPIRTGGKAIQGNGMGLGASPVGAGGTGVQARVAASKVHSGSGGGGLSIGGSGLEASGQGQLSDDAILNVLRKNMERFRYCYEKSLLKDATLAGVLKAGWTISPSGAVTAPSVVQSELRDPELQSCVTKTLQSLKFPAPKGGSVQVVYPFNFKSGAY